MASKHGGDKSGTANFTHDGRVTTISSTHDVRSYQTWITQDHSRADHEQDVDGPEWRLASMLAKVQILMTSQGVQYSEMGGFGLRPLRCALPDLRNAPSCKAALAGLTDVDLYPFHGRSDFLRCVSITKTIRLLISRTVKVIPFNFGLEKERLPLAHRTGPDKREIITEPHIRSPQSRRLGVATSCAIMSKDQAPIAAPQALLFVDDSPALPLRRRKTARQAKAHTARVNWERHKKSKGQRSPTSNGDVAVPRRQKRTESATSQAAEETAVQPNRVPRTEPHDTLSLTRGIPGSTRASFLPTSLGYTTPASTRVVTPELLWPHTLSASLSPVFGALPASTFPVERSATIASTADYCFNLILKNTLQPQQISSWFLAFSQSPVVYHALSYTVGAHQEIVSGSTAALVQQQALVHKGQTIKIINELLNDLDNADTEAMILAMFILWRVNAATKQSDQREETLLFSPYMPGANWLSVYGRAEAVDMHAQAMYWLVARLGGLEQVKLPGLQMVLSMCVTCYYFYVIYTADIMYRGDLIESTVRCTKPRFPCVWDVSESFQTLYPILRASDVSVGGAGFASCVPRGLPTSVLETLQWLASMEHLLERAHHARLDDTYFGTLIAARNGVQHKVLAMPRWQELSESEREGSFFATYETCRITALIYSNAVLFPMPPSTGWLNKLLDELRQLIEVSNLSSWRDDTSALLIWSFYIGAIAAFSTVHRKFFRDALSHTLTARGIKTWPATEAILQQFLWTDSACGQGAAVLWETMQQAAS
ncbi:hypothetical protein LTR10_007306 [Elasticomyces elasticus]|nr:hypothetical protein LTR10_007306 [Elasticomyces elasticus]KAK4979118.1 hypothetical protein LTR42_001620 [Elasticomyces elasticus]